MDRKIISMHEKAFEINLGPAKYGTFAEIGAGQEVAHWFFPHGAAGIIEESKLFGWCETNALNRTFSHSRSIEAPLELVPV